MMMIVVFLRLLLSLFGSFGLRLSEIYPNNRVGVVAHRISLAQAATALPR